MQSTKSINTVGGQYNLQRQLIHEDILQKNLEGLKPATELPLAIFLGGGSASGKSSISKMLTESFREDAESVVVIDSDKIKAMLPEHKPLIRSFPDKAANILHDESSDIAENLYKRALQEKVNLIFDGTMKNAQKYEKLISAAKEHGYEVSLVLADVSLEEALQRAEKRFQIEQRRVPDEIIIKSHQEVPMTFRQLKDLADSFYLYDTTRRHPEWFYCKEDGQIIMKNEDRLREFYQKSGSLVDWKQWIEPDFPTKLIDVLKQTNGLPVEINKEQLNQPIDRYQVERLEGDVERVNYFVKGIDKPAIVNLQTHMWLSQDTKNLLLDQISVDGPGLQQVNDLSMEI